MVTQARLTVAKWSDLQLPRPGHKTDRAPSCWFGAADAGGHPELGQVTGEAGGGTRPEASGFRRSFQVRQTDRYNDSLPVANWLLPVLPPPHSHKQGKLRAREGRPVYKGQRAGESAPGFLKS